MSGELNDIEKEVDEVEEKESLVISALKEIMEKLDMDPAVRKQPKKKQLKKQKIFSIVIYLLLRE